LSTFHFTDAERRITLIGLLIVFLLAALDQTIVSTAMPVIIAQLHGLALYAWVTTAYMLASTVMVPIWGKLGDLFGRKPVLLAGVALFLLGSWLSGLAGEFAEVPLLGGGMTQLIAARAVQGLGGGALFTSAFAIIADLFPPRERGKFSGLFGGVFGLASAVGPLIGGYFTDHGTCVIAGHTIAGWRWVFYFNVPLGLISVFMIVARMPKLRHRATGSIDYLGAILIVLATVPLLLALTFGGQKFPWGSPIVVGLLSTFVIATGLFVLVEKRVADPMIHLELFGNRVFTYANLAGFFSSMSFLSVAAFLPLFLQLGQGLSATVSGLSILPLMFGLILSSTVSGRLVTRSGRYKPYLVGGMVLLLIGTCFMSVMNYRTGHLDLGWRMALYGLGLGPLQGLFSLAIQNAVPVSRIGVGTSASQFFRQIGSTVGIAIFGTLLTSDLDGKLLQWSRSTGQAPLSLSHLRGLSIEAQASAGTIDLPEPVRILISNSVTHVIALSLVVVVLALLTTLAIPEVPLRERSRVESGDPVPADIGA
jgi:EmrB/QacA subfamily drug resistance transporter